MSATIYIPFTSPFLSFSPYADGPANGGWNASGGGFSSYAPAGAADGVRWTYGGGSSMSFSFNGSAAHVYGSSSSSSLYTLSVDGASPTTSDGLLGSFTNLASDSLHTLTLNTSAAAGSDWLALEHVELVVPTGGNNNYTFDDADTSHFNYEGPWGVGAAASQGTYMQTSTYTQQASASANINFTGSALYLFGSVQPDHGVYSISFDGVPQGKFNGSSKAGFVQQLLWFGSGWENTLHEVVVTDVDGSKLDVDYIVVKSAPDTLRTRRIAGITVGASVAAIIVASIVFWIWRTERNGRRKLEDYVQTYLREKEGY